MSDMLKVIPKTWSYAFSVTDGVQSVAEVVDLSWWRDKSQIRTHDEIYTARRDKSSYVLESAAGVFACAEQPRKCFRELVIKCSGQRYTLRAKSPLRRQFLIFRDSTQIGSLSPEGLFRRTVTAELPREFPLILQIFVIWLAMTLWKHEES